MPAKANLIGQKFGRLTVVSESRDKNGALTWRCLCECGGFAEPDTTRLRTGKTQSCGCLHRDKMRETLSLDVRGKRFGMLVAISPSRTGHGVVGWDCLCDCGARTVVATGKLTHGHTKSCGCLKVKKAVERKLLNLAGKKFGRLTAIRPIQVRHGYRGWLCKCDCGNETRVITAKLTTGHTKSCGKGECFSAHKHGMSGSKIYGVLRFHKRRAKELSSGGSCSVDEWNRVVSEHDSSCVGCGSRIEPTGFRGRMISVDHIAPIKRGGTGWPTNLQPLCGPCNRSKGTQDFWLWMHKKHPERCTPEYIAEWHSIRKRIERWFSRRQQQAA